VDLVVNLAAGLDARPYRLALPPSLTWIEVDLPELLDFKEAALESEKSSCVLERIRLDLSDREARRELFEELGRRAQKALILTEGLLLYLTRQEVGSLAEDLARPPPFQRWILDVVSPGLLRMIQRNWGKNLGDAGAPPKFAPLEGPPFFRGYGWDPTQVRSVFQAAARAKRLPFLLQLMARLPESTGPQGSRPWSGICLLARR
jgi:O-methyltransferase involved in polyketide biosynthesis